MSAAVWTATLPLRPISKKNSKRIIMVGGRPRLISSQAYLDFEKAAGYLLGPLRPSRALSGPLQATIHVACKGRLDIDYDNAASGINDILQKYEIIAEDKLIVDAHVTKSHGHKDWSVTITVRGQET